MLVVNEDTLETGLEEAYSSFNNSAATFLHTNAGLDSSGPASKLVLKFFIALWCGCCTAVEDDYRFSFSLPTQHRVEEKGD